MNVLFVCTGNVCRSPMAEAFLSHEAERRGLDLDVRSTGTHAFVGRAATIPGRKIMQELGVPMDEHRTSPFTRDLVDWADLVVALATEHVRETAREFPEAERKTFLLKEIVDLLPHVGPTDDPTELVDSLADAHDRATPPSDIDVADPYGAQDEAYRVVATEIQGLISALVELLDETYTTT